MPAESKAKLAYEDIPILLFMVENEMLNAPVDIENCVRFSLNCRCSLWRALRPI